MRIEIDDVIDNIVDIMPPDHKYEISRTYYKHLTETCKMAVISPLSRKYENSGGILNYNHRFDFGCYYFFFVKPFYDKKAAFYVDVIYTGTEGGENYNTDMYIHDFKLLNFLLETLFLNTTNLIIKNE